MVHFIIFCQTLVLFICIASDGTATAGGTRHTAVERYVYRAIPLDDERGERAGETVEVELRQDNEVIQYVSRVTSITSQEVTTVTMEPGGFFLSGTKTVSDDQGKTIKKYTVARETDKVLIRRTTGSRVKLTEIELPVDTTLAVDGSLLVLLRNFPFGSDKAWTLFMVDFSGAAITVTARQAGTDMIATPAGDFECYRMEVLVNIPLLRPKLTYWISKQTPHFLVRSVGKRGPFTGSYEMTLTSRKLPFPAAHADASVQPMVQYLSESGNLRR